MEDGVEFKLQVCRGRVPRDNRVAEEDERGHQSGAVTLDRQTDAPERLSCGMPASTGLAHSSCQRTHGLTAAAFVRSTSSKHI
jgi:hypothetical protein